MHESPIRGRNGGTASPDVLMVASASEMLATVDRVARGMIPEDCPSPEELMREVAVDERNPKLVRPAYFLSAGTWRASVRGVVQKMGARNFAVACRLGIQRHLDSLEKLWPGRWAVVAVVRELGARQRGERVTKEDPARAMALRGAAAGAFTPESAAQWKDQTPDVTQVHRLAVVNEEDIIVHFAIAELRQREIFDPLAALQAGHKGGAWHTFGNTGLLRDMPPTFRAKRDIAKALIEEYHGQEAAAGRRSLTPEERTQVLGMLQFAPVERVAAAMRMPLDLVLRIQAEAAKADALEVAGKVAGAKPPPQKRKPKASAVDAPAPSDTLE